MGRGGWGEGLGVGFRLFGGILGGLRAVYVGFPGGLAGWAAAGFARWTGAKAFRGEEAPKA